jgi:hypothetical protein
MGAEIFIRGKVGPGIRGAFARSILYQALSNKHPELVLWGAMNPPKDGYSYCTVTSERNGVVRELAVIRLTDCLEEQIAGPFGEKRWVDVDAVPGSLKGFPHSNEVGESQT